MISFIDEHRPVLGVEPIRRLPPIGTSGTVEASASESLFVPAVVASPSPEPEAQRPSRPRRKNSRASGVIELEIDGIAMRVGRGADEKRVAAIIRALKATS